MLESTFASAHHRIQPEETRNAGRPEHTTPTNSPPCSVPLSSLLALPAASDVIRGASAQGGRSEVPATLPVATQITLGAFAFNFTAARCANLPRFTPNATVQWTSKATPNFPACKNLTFWSGASCSGTSSYFLTRLPSLITNTSQATLPYSTAVSARCAIDNMCQYTKCPAGSSCKTTTDTRGVTCACNEGLYAYQGTCQTLEIAVQSPAYDAAIDVTAMGAPTEVEAKLPVATQLAVGAYSVPFDPSSRCTRVPEGTTYAGVSTPVSVQWGTTSSQGGGASAPCSSLWFFSGSSCNSGTSFSSLSKTASSQTAMITPTTPLASIDCPIASPCKYASCPNNSVCLDASGSKRATCKCDEGYIAVNGTCRDKCSVLCPVNAYCIRDAVLEPQCYCNKGFDMSAEDGTCVDKCASVNCALNKTCTKDADGTPSCTCSTGFKLAADNTTCIDKCELVTCKASSSCARDADGNTRCDCIKGFERLLGNDTCADKCLSVKCALNKTCTKDAAGTPSCVCSTGFKLAADNTTCIDNCAAVNCGLGGKCVYKENGDPTCSCDAGYQMPPDKLVCVDKCASVNCGPNGKCEKDAAGNPFCNCTTGFKPSADNLTCIDTCAAANCGPNGTCVKKQNGDPTCSCNAGYQMPPDKLVCVDLACYVLGCEPEGVCVNNNGVRSCKWNSPCGSCPRGAVCKTTKADLLKAIDPQELIRTVDAPYCECPAGYGMTPTECIKGAPDQVLSTSMTLIRDPTAKDKASKPYTFRFKNGCTQYPKEVAGNYTAFYSVININGIPNCQDWEAYTTDNCTSTPERSGHSGTTFMYAAALL
ncbi:unnamed protein product [Closterium sp. NIES-53]